MKVFAVKSDDLRARFARADRTEHRCARPQIAARRHKIAARSGAGQRWRPQVHLRDCLENLRLHRHVFRAVAAPFGDQYCAGASRPSAGTASAGWPLPDLPRVLHRRQRRHNHPVRAMDVCAICRRAASSSPSTAATRCATRATLAGRCAALRVRKLLRRAAHSAPNVPVPAHASWQRRGRATAAATSRCGAWRKRTRRACLPPTLQSRGAAGTSGSRRFARSGPHVGADCPHSPRGSLATFFRSSSSSSASRAGRRLDSTRALQVILAISCCCYCRQSGILFIWTVRLDTTRTPRAGLSAY